MGSIRTGLGAIGMDEQGGGAATPILFLHGVGSDKKVWRPQLTHFGQSRRAIALDYPGYGESDFLAGASRDDFARAALAAMDALGVGSAHVCGLSLGGVIAIAMHALAANRCASLILADTFASHPDGAGIHERSVAATQAMTMRTLAEARVDILIGSAATAALRSEVVETMAAIDPKSYRIGAEAVWLAAQEERAAAIQVPALVLCGEEDRITPPGLSTQLAAIIPGAQVQIIADAGHLANAEQPAAFNAAINRFLTEVEQNFP